jgi:hypothetical protein
MNARTSSRNAACSGDRVRSIAAELGTAARRRETAGQDITSRFARAAEPVSRTAPPRDGYGQVRSTPIEFGGPGLQIW